MAECIHCQQKLTYCGPTTNLWMHAIGKHNVPDQRKAVHVSKKRKKKHISKAAQKDPAKKTSWNIGQCRVVMKPAILYVFFQEAAALVD